VRLFHACCHAAPRFARVVIGALLIVFAFAPQPAPAATMF
jgi:hypothetical protein